MNIQLEPIISILLKENDININVIDLIIENVGQGIAKNLKFEFNPTGFITLSGDPINKLYLFQNGIQNLGSRQKIIFHLTNLAQKINEIKRENPHLEGNELLKILKQGLKFEMVITYESINGEMKKSDTYNIDLCIFWGLRTPSVVRMV